MRLTLPICALLAAGCPAGLEEQSHVGKLRVLGVRADPPELVLDPDAGLPAATLTALAVTPAGNADAVRFAICTQLGTPSPTLPCPGDAGFDLPEAGAFSARLDLSDPRIVAAARALDGGTLDSLDEGVALIVGFTATAGEERLDGFLTITLRSPLHGPAGANPVITALQIDEPVHAGETVRLTPVTGPKDDPSKKYVFSFFATGGSISSLHSTDITGSGQPAPVSVEWTAPSMPGLVRLWSVVRDGRGGTAWIEKDIDTGQ